MVKEESWEYSSPDGNIEVKLELVTGKLRYSVWSNGVQVLDWSAMGVVRADTDLSRELSFVERSETTGINETITFLSGKQLRVVVAGTYQHLTFANPGGELIQLELKLFNDGLALRYVFPEDSGNSVNITKDLTEFTLPVESRAWLQPYDRVTDYSPAYERYYKNGIETGTSSEFGNGWCFPALFKVQEQWLLISEAGVDGNFSGSHLNNKQGSSVYTLRWPESEEAKGMGEAIPSGSLPWQTSWKTIAIGDLNTVIKSDLVKIVSPRNRIRQSSWIKPGRVSWSWLSDHPSPRSFRKLKSFIDLAAEMGWEYSLIDANWDQMEEGSIEELVKYAAARDVGILLWYNSGGDHNAVTEAPRNIMSQHSTRRAEFQRLSQMGVKGVKIDFFQSDKQFIMELYHQILEDAAEFRILVNFHGCTIPRGWSRAYPNLLTMESVRGGECYSFDESFATRAPELNTILPFTRNVIGSMDYTPVIFSNLVTPHLTSYGHEIALSVVFESGLLHFGDGVDAYHSLGPEAKQFLMEIPVTWDQVELISGTPGKELVLARRKGHSWYIAGINGENISKQWEIDLTRFEGEYSVLKIVDGEAPDQFICKEGLRADRVALEVLPYGGFVMRLTPLTL